MKVAIVGAGWAGMAAAVTATQAGHTVTVFEAARVVGGRARALSSALPDDSPVVLDNGQHILIGAYTETLKIMRTVGVDPEQTLRRLPLTLTFPDGQGLTFPRWPAPLNAMAGILSARGWTGKDKFSMLRVALEWRIAGFVCGLKTTVADLCHGVTPTVRATLIDPLCVSALNTPAERASGQVFLTVLHDSLLGARGSSDLLLPRVDLGTLFPQAAADWLRARGGSVHVGARVNYIGAQSDGRWHIDDQTFDAVLLATPPSGAAVVLVQSMPLAPVPLGKTMQAWATVANALRSEAIATVYAYGKGVRLPQPMLALHSSKEHPAQFVFDRGQLGGPPGLLAFVVSSSPDNREAVQTQVLEQAQVQLGLELTPVQTVLERRATFACTLGIQRPTPFIAPGLWACGDYLHGPYPATLEGAVRSGVAVASQLPVPGLL